MQYPVPQFTDVEDKLIGPLSIKQFGILFAAGIIIVLFYTATKSILVGIFLIVLIGIPALGMAFAKINGRPIYNLIPVLIKFFTSPKFLVFHKESGNFSQNAKLKDADLGQKENLVKARAEAVNPKDKIKEINALLSKQAEEEERLVKDIK